MKTTIIRQSLKADAVISPDGRYRYKLARYWNYKQSPVVFIMLNPSTADAVENDPTVRRCISFAKRWGYGGVEVYNLFALRSHDPAVIETAGDPIGPDNDNWLRRAVGSGRKIIAAWGSCHTNIQSRRAKEVMKLFVRCGSVRPAALGITKSGQPRHPLYARGDAKLLPFSNICA